MTGYRTKRTVTLTRERRKDLNEERYERIHPHAYNSLKSEHSTVTTYCCKFR